MEHCEHQQAKTDTAATAATVTLHCLAGCSIGEFIGLAIGVQFGLSVRILFGLAIIVTILSFWASQKGIKVQLAYNYKYYLEGEDEYGTKTNSYAVATDVLNYLSGGLFMAAVFFTILFVTINI